MIAPVDELIEAVERINARWLEYVASPTHGDIEAELIQMLVDLLDAHGRFYLQEVNDLESHRRFLETLREAGGEFLQNALRPTVNVHGVLPVGFVGDDGSFGPSTGPLSLTMLPVAEMRFEARYAHWSAEARVKLRSLPSFTGAVPSQSPSTKTRIENFLTAASETANCNCRVTKTMFWRAVGHTDASVFEAFQIDSPKCSKAGRTNFNRLLGLTPQKFVELLLKKNLLP